jgi:predicted lysophospholipase L1 biosynthesis ABC-type transport system permease subunit
MANQIYFIALIASLIGLVLGFVLAYVLTRRSMAAQLLAAQEQGRAGAAVEIATFSERLRANESDRQHIE